MASSGWHVTGQVSDQTVLTNAGQAVTGVLVYFTTGDGHSGSVFIPDNHYTNKKYVHDAIQAKAVVMDEVGKLAQAPG